jgi:hypothetical protein
MEMDEVSSIMVRHAAAVQVTALMGVLKRNLIAEETEGLH